MSIVLPILFYVVVVGLFAKRMTPSIWVGIIAWICLVTIYNYVKH